MVPHSIAQRKRTVLKPEKAENAIKKPNPIEAFTLSSDEDDNIEDHKEIRRTGDDEKSGLKSTSIHPHFSPMLEPEESNSDGVTDDSTDDSTGGQINSFHGRRVSRLHKGTGDEREDIMKIKLEISILKTRLLILQSREKTESLLKNELKLLWYRFRISIVLAIIGIVILIIVIYSCLAKQN